MLAFFLLEKNEMSLTYEKNGGGMNLFRSRDTRRNLLIFSYSKFEVK